MSAWSAYGDLVVIEIIARYHPPRDPMAPLPRLVPPLALMAVIFVLSAQPDLSSGLGTADLILRKLVHMTEYGLLWWLWSRALALGSPAAPRRSRSPTPPPTSSTRPSSTAATARHDVAIDAVGIFLAYLAVKALRNRRGRPAPA